MTAEKSKFKIRKTVIMFLAVIVLPVIVSSCGGNTDGDIDAYCNLISKNLELGIPDSNLPIEELDLLITLAPSEVRKIVTKIRNSSADIAEITNLDQLFAATFDPEALSAQSAFQTFNTENCDISIQEVEDVVLATQRGIQADLDDFLLLNYSEETWNEKAEISVIFNGIEISGIQASLMETNEVAAAASLCQALSLWLYAVQERDGVVLINSADSQIIERKSEYSNCRLNEIADGD
ncbi:MAG: hypothetical protein QF596_04370 [Acidimicrobiales bacterium]|jgi:hypothetical protein|nr:hypothetical protein [Acidimicrobiales bacterium]MDP6297946.1 hypothetical protein [Acidimicrobiales bacterium]HJM27943.1 hypothetical protein [Acidimicrobiales bacterium]HJM98329.1 hypothetical protein [Acidimicrobiales bacterium]